MEGVDHGEVGDSKIHRRGHFSLFEGDNQSERNDPGGKVWMTNITTLLKLVNCALSPSNNLKCHLRCIVLSST